MNLACAKDFGFKKFAFILLLGVTIALNARGAMGQAVTTPTDSLAPASPQTSPASGHPFDSEVTALEATLSQSLVAPGPIVFYGSSSIRRWKSLSQDFPGYSVLNCG